MEINREEKNYVKLVKRSTQNNTHSNIVDDSIKEITSWKVDSGKRGKLICLYIISFGVLFIITSIWDSLFIDWACVPCDANQAEYFVILDTDNKKFVKRTMYENFFFTNKMMQKLIDRPASKNQLEGSPYLGSEFQNKRDETIVINYRSNKYIYIENKNSFIPVTFELNRFTNKEVHEKLGLKKRNGTGLNNLEEYNYLLNKFGKNMIVLKNKSFFIILLEQLVNPFYIYQVYAMVVWGMYGYVFNYITCACIVVILLINTTHQHRNYNRILNFKNPTSATVTRDFKIDQNIAKKLKLEKSAPEDRESFTKNSIKNNYDSMFIVPGDIIELKKEEILPCDCLILDGYCTVNESDLTGESTLIMKSPLPYDNREFNYEVNSKSFLYQGTKISKCESAIDNDSGVIHALVLNTGYSTNRGNLIQNLLFPKPSNFNFYGNLKVFGILMGGIWIITSSTLVYLKFKYDWAVTLLVRRIFDNLTVVIPPGLPITLTFTSFYFHYALSKKNISCISDKKMNASGLINVLVLDKTGTLTEEILEIYGFQTTKKSISSREENSGDISFEEISQDTRIMNRVHKSFWKKFCENPSNPGFRNYQTHPKNNMIFFLQCLATCHSIDKFKNDSLGNSVDKKMFEKVNWIQEKVENPEFAQTLSQEDIKYIIKPKNAYKITENLIFKTNLNSSNEHLFGRKFDLKIVKRYEFSSKYQSMSVIVRNCLDDSYRFFIKGAPEKIALICDKSSLPRDFDEMQMEHTKNGFRVLACATKLLPNREDYHLEEDRAKLECNVTFLGFIIFHNKLKRDTKHVIANLRNSNCKLVMATGDNPFTSLSVARECEMIENRGNNVFLIDIEKDYSDEVERLKIMSLLKDNELTNKSVQGHHNHSMDISNFEQRRKSKVHKTRSMSIEMSNLFNMPSSNRKLINENSKLAPSSSNIDVSNQNLISNRRLSMDERKFIYEKEFLRNLQLIIKNKVNLCVSGKAFNFILNKYREEKAISQQIEGLKKTRKGVNPEEENPQEKVNNNYQGSNYLYTQLIKLVGEKGNIFFRMSPTDKVDLVNFFKEDKSSIVAMCGDGANDCGALLSADVGISVRQTKGNNITAHFYSSEESISCVEIILKNGRACYENSIIIFKSMILYAIVQISTIILLNSSDRDLTNNQWLFIDFFVCLVSILLASKTGPSYKLIKENPESSLVNIKFISSIFGQIVIQVGSLIGYFLYFQHHRVDFSTDTGPEADLYIFTSYIFIFSSFQYISVIFSFNANSKHRKKFYANKLYILYLAFLIFYIISNISMVNTLRLYFGRILVNFEDLGVSSNQDTGETNRMMTICWCWGNFFLTYFFESLVEYLYSRRKNKME